jgi:hypothetical protein
MSSWLSTASALTPTQLERCDLPHLVLKVFTETEDRVPFLGPDPNVSRAELEWATGDFCGTVGGSQVVKPGPR